MAFIIALSRPGYNWNDTDHSHLIFHSSDNCPKVFAKGSVIATSLAGFATTTITVAHNQLFIPFVDCMFKHPTNGNFYPCLITSDALNAYITITNPTGSAASITAYYKIGFEGSA